MASSPSNSPPGPTDSSPEDNSAQTSHNAAHLKQRRARSQLSCKPCRTGKLKCNREKPACDQCVKRSRDATCVYLPPPSKNKPSQNVKGRIRQLESLVVDLMNQNREGRGSQPDGVRDSIEKGHEQRPFDQPTPPSDNDAGPQPRTRSRNSKSASQEDVDSATAPFGQMRISKNEISYVGETHWGAILDSISGLKRDLDEESEAESEENYTISNTVHGGAPISSDSASPDSSLPFMLGHAKAMTRAELIAAVPEKKVTDRLLSLWFNAPDPFKVLIHAPAFQDEYRRFWKEPEKTPVMWLGLLFAIVSLAVSFGLRDADPASPQAKKILEQSSKYHGHAASAAVLADYTKPKEHTLECLILYSAGLRSNNAFVNVWLMLGFVVRLGLRMGYHRDPKHYPKITPFQGEMRRRVWAMISMIDVLISFQLGLPSMVKNLQCDVEAPRNLLDRDFGVDTQVLPPSRSIEELTPCSYTRVKLKITRVFAEAAEQSHMTVPPTHDQVMELDRQLEEAKAAVPPLLQMSGITDLVTDPPEQLMCRFNLDLLYLKTKLVLHRRYMNKGNAALSPDEHQLGIGKSRYICIEAALRVLQHHHTIYVASQPGGQLETVKWYMGSISTHDFLLAAMILCLELSWQINDLTMQASPRGIQCPRRRAMMDAIERSARIWSSASGRKPKKIMFGSGDSRTRGEHMFDETDRASRAMLSMLENVREQFPALARSPTPEPEAEAKRKLIDRAHQYQDFGVRDVPTEASTYVAKVLGESKMFQAAAPVTDWGDMTGVPTLSAGVSTQSAGSGPTPPFAYDGSASGSNGISPTVDSTGYGSVDQVGPQQQSQTITVDYGNPFGNMDGLDGTNFDWQDWDNAVYKTVGTDFNLAEPSYDAGTMDVDPANYLFGNVLMNQQGPGRDSFDRTVSGSGATIDESMTGLAGPIGLSGGYDEYGSLDQTGSFGAGVVEDMSYDFSFDGMGPVGRVGWKERDA